MRLAISTHSSGDILSRFSAALLWLTTKHVVGTSLLDTFDQVNGGGETFVSNFCNPDGMLDPKVLVCLISMACLPEDGFASLIQHIFFRNDASTFSDPRTLQAEIHSFSTRYQASSRSEEPSTQGQSYVAMKGSKPSLTAPVPSDPSTYCPSCFARTGNYYSNHGIAGNPPCIHVGKLANSPPVPYTAPFRHPPKSYIASPSGYTFYQPHPQDQQYPPSYPQQVFQSNSFPSASPHQQPLPSPLQAGPSSSVIETKCRAFLAHLDAGGPTEVTNTLFAELYESCT